LRRLVFTIDSSKTSLRALPLAAAVARTFEAEMDLVHLLLPGSQMLVVPEYPVDNTYFAETGAKTLLEALRQRPELKSVKLGSAAVVMGLSDFRGKVAPRDIDLIVSGASVDGRFHTRLCGCGIEEIIHGSTCSVLAVGPRASIRDDAQFRPKHLLFVAFSAADYSYALSFANVPQYDVRFLNADYRHSGAVKAHSVAAFAHDILATISFGRIKNSKFDLLLRSWQTVHDVIYAAHERPTELIVMCRRDHLTQSALNKRICRRIIAEAPCPVLVVNSEQCPLLNTNS